MEKLNKLYRRIEQKVDVQLEKPFAMLKDVLDKLEAHPKLVEIAISFGLVTAAISPLVLAGYALAASPIVATVTFISAAVGALAIAVKTVYDNWKLLKSEFTNNPIESVVDMLSSFTGGLIPSSEAWKNVANAIGKTVGPKNVSTGYYEQMWKPPTFFGLGAEKSEKKTTDSYGQMWKTPTLFGLGAEKSEKSEADIKIHVTSDPGTTATIGPVRTKGKPSLDISSLGYVGIGGF